MEKSFDIELKTNQNNTYLIAFSLGNVLGIEANQKNNLIKKSFSNEFTFDEIIEKNSYFKTFNSLEVTFDELNYQITEEKKTTVEENENNLKIIIPVPNRLNKEIIFSLKQNNKNDNEKINDLTQLINKQNQEISELKNENIQLKNEINELKRDINDIKVKINILSKSKEERKTIANLKSKIISEDEEIYNVDLKKWINPTKNIKAELLYRLSENGEKYETFHQLCDKKGPTLTLFHLKENGHKIGIYTPLSWDQKVREKSDTETFIFNLNKEEKYIKLKRECSIQTDNTSGPRTQYLGCHHNNENDSMKFLYCYNGKDNNSQYILDLYYEKGSEILPITYDNRKYELIEVEVFKIIIE